ncbi:hypothetical protein QN357_01410 [Cryobacterium sp. RTC2.1]|uniref:hypothetical protein n=1 Tax=Cryobacterium sp. RTC2.1 TaxID=3048634 RepID=UPI002B22B0E1|nr:hypothetical protein [Cryobacterium sp. RTC2.1]MEB0001593.1 hypothetical protein [Cryobacterium sp. RTC2.1]
MTDIIFRFSNPSPTGVDVPASGFVECSLVVVEQSVTGTRTLERFSVELVDGLAAAPLSPTALGQAWHIIVQGVAGVHEFFKAVPVDADPIRYDALVDVDPGTLTITPTTQAAWDATLTDVAASASAAGSAAASAATAAGTAGTAAGAASTAAVAATTAAGAASSAATTAASRAAAAETARAAAVTAAASVPSRTELAATYAPKTGAGSPIAVSVAMSIALRRN